MKHHYKTYTQTCAFLEECVQKYPDLISIKSIGKTWEDRDIMQATLSINVENADLKPALLFTGSIHAREWIGNELGVAFIEYLLTNYNKDPKVLEVLTKNTLYIVPCANPDGFSYSHSHFSFWRKNRRDNKNGTYGVDLNRNFSIGYSPSSNTSSNVYSGPKPFSEPETRALKDFVDSHENITIALDYHSQGNVFFPAHNFRHESELDGTDLNTLCANMNDKIFKVTGRKYGIHRGKPPTKLISGSGREYYYSKGIIAAVVEVGTRNIPDFMQNMQASIDENIPALLLAMGEARNYSRYSPKRVDNFCIDSIESNSIILKWDYESLNDVYFEIYRSTKNKEACNASNLVATTKERHFTDIQLNSGTSYYYYIRAVHDITKVKSAFAPKIKVKTMLNSDEFSMTIFPNSTDVGYVAENTEEFNRKHFGVNSLFIGVDETRGVSYGVMKYNLKNIPNNAIVKEARISLYSLNRVNAKIENYGEWAISFLNSNSVSDITDFTQVHNATIIQTLAKTIPSDRLTQGKWSHWEFNKRDKTVFQDHLKDDSIIFKIEGATTLPQGRDSQMMMFDIGYGSFGGGLHYRPNLEILYTIPSFSMEIEASSVATISQSSVNTSSLSCGYDEDKNSVVGLMEFDLSSLPDPKKTVITDSYIEIRDKKSNKISEDIRYNVEFMNIDEVSYSSIKNRDNVEFIGYEVGTAQLNKQKTHTFIFDALSKIRLEKIHEKENIAKFIIKPTTAVIKNNIVSWKSDKSLKLVVKYINKRKEPLANISNLQTSIENGKIKLEWNNPTDEDFVGCYVVRNHFHIPTNPFDGDKLYAGSDEFTYDSFGSMEINKYYSVFTYDNVPNYSEAMVVEYKV